MTRMLSVMALAAAVAACGSHEALNPVAPLASGATAAAVATGPAGQGPRVVAREVTGTLAGRFDFTHLWGDEWWEFYSDSTGAGTVTHLGWSELRTRHIPDLATGALTEGTFALVAANGDEIHGTYEGSATYDAERADLVHGTAAFVITGGTGRFAGATGTFTATFLEVLDDPTWASAGVTWTLEGTVRY
jgi:hypothetical protein